MGLAVGLFTGIISAFVDNVAAVLMVGGNLTPIGASANIAGLGILCRAGYDVKATTFMKISVPFTLAAVITGYLLVWLIWKCFSPHTQQKAASSPRGCCLLLCAVMD